MANNQTKLSTDLYQGLRDNLGHDGAQDMGHVGHVILPSTHKGGPCYSICSNFFMIPWPSIESVESLISFSP